MRIPRIGIPVLGCHVVPLNRREMTAPLGRGLARWSRIITFNGIHGPLSGTDMSEALGIRKISRSRGHLNNEARLHIHTAVLFIAVPILLLAFAANPGLLV